MRRRARQYSASRRRREPECMSAERAANARLRVVGRACGRCPRARGGARRGRAAARRGRRRLPLSAPPSLRSRPRPCPRAAAAARLLAVPQARARVGAALQRLRQAQRPWLAWGASGRNHRRWLRREAACPARPWQRAALFGGGDGLASCTGKAVRRRSSYASRHRLEAPATLPRQQLHTAPRATPGRAGRRAARGCALRSRPLAALRLSTSHACRPPCLLQRPAATALRQAPQV